jgi:hypothetical protein
MALSDAWNHALNIYALAQAAARIQPELALELQPIVNAMSTLHKKKGTGTTKAKGKTDGGAYRALHLVVDRPKSVKTSSCYDKYKISKSKLSKDAYGDQTVVLTSEKIVGSNEDASSRPVATIGIAAPFLRSVCAGLRKN